MDDILEDRRRIKKSLIEEAFTPHTPVVDDLFCGRKKEIESIIEGLSEKGNHIVLYGDRGVGKTSLARYSCRKYEETENTDTNNIMVSCCANDTFQSVIEKVFTELGVELVEAVQSASEVKLDVKFLGYSREKSGSIKNTINFDNPAWVANKLKDNKGVVIIDEFDTIKDSIEKQKFSTLMKILSDKSSNLSLLIVGISLSVNDLIEGHRSIDRCLSQVYLKRMTKDELLSIIQKGENRTGLKFNEDVKNKIVEKSLGFPYYVHMLALEASKNAVLSERNEINNEDYKEGLKNTITKIDYSLRDMYQEAIGFNDSTEKKRIIYAAAKIGDKGTFTMKAWIESYKYIYNADIKNVTINSTMKKNISKDGLRLITSIKRGLYIFNDSRLPCYILLLGKPE